MFGNAKPVASLSSGLLARKGQARPAMRPQGFVGMNGSLEDLGWNDMGGATAAVDTAPIAEPVVPPVVLQREALEQEMAVAALPPSPPSPTPVQALAPPAVESRPVPDGKLTRIGREVRGTGKKAKAKTKPKAAFTLRLDADRHLRLRLASAVRHRSAQQLVTEALDNYLATIAEVDPLIDRLDGAAKRTPGKAT